MKKIALAQRNLCTGCGSCVESCPAKCIQMEQDQRTDSIYPSIDTLLCLECGRCQLACPALTRPKKQEMGTVYAAWNTNQEQRKNAASGGAMSAIYHYALNHEIKTFGVQYSPAEGAKYVEILNHECIQACRNSKYVFSDIRPILKTIKQYIKEGHTVILPALPCQVAAVLAFLGKRPENLILVDIVCHGVCPEAYLRQHVATIEKRTKKKADRLFFRDPEYGTGRFVFTLYSGMTRIYHAAVHKRDVYQIGYHRALLYRENCYHCIYATPERLGDLTVADFSGLGREAPFERDSGAYSCVIVSSKKGQELLNALHSEGKLDYQLRPSSEAFTYERQLRAPSIPHKKRNVFLAAYEKTRNFEESARRALRLDIVKNDFVNFFKVEQVRQVIVRLLPKGIKQFIKKVIKHGK